MLGAFLLDLCICIQSFKYLKNIRRLTCTSHFCRWWDCIALPDDVDHSDEASFRMQIKELAFTVGPCNKEKAFEKKPD